MRLRATAQINSSYGTFPPGRIFSVPDDVGGAWIDARLAEEAPAAPQKHGADSSASSAAPAPKPLHRMNKAELTEIAESMGLDTGGSNKQLVERIQTARAEAEQGS